MPSFVAASLNVRISFLSTVDLNEEGTARIVTLTERVSPFLLHLLRENPPCNHFLPGIAGCNRVLERCRDHPEEVLHRCPETGQTVLHEACAQASCCHVINAILDTTAELTIMLDSASNTPLHLWFGGLSARHMEREETDQIIDRLLQPQPRFVAGVRNREGCLPVRLLFFVEDESVSDCSDLVTHAHYCTCRISFSPTIMFDTAPQCVLITRRNGTNQRYQ